MAHFDIRILAIFFDMRRLRARHYFDGQAFQQNFALFPLIFKK